MHTPPANRNHVSNHFENRHFASARAAFTRMELVVGLAVVLVLLSIAFPIYFRIRLGKHKQVALEKMKQLGGAAISFAQQNGDLLPEEDAEDKDTWPAIASPEAKNVWYNALPRLLGKKGAGDFTPQDFYSDDNLVYLPGANYPDKKKYAEPQFAIAFNTKLQRNDPSGKKERIKLGQITDPGKTVLLLEQGCLNESRTLKIQTKSDYDGSPKGSAKSFVGRYSGRGHLCFADGHVDLVKAADLLTNTGDFPFPQDTVVWTPTPGENPNKNAAQPTSPKKQ